MAKNIDISLIKPNPRNPRVIKDDKFAKLVESLRSFPQMLEKRPLVCVTDAADGLIFPLGGNMRLKAAQSLKMAVLPVEMADDWTEEQRQEFIIKDNVGFGEWDWEALQSDWDIEKLGDWGLDIPAGFATEEAVEDDYETPDEIVTDIVPGDLFEIGPHRLMCGSSTEADNWGKLMNGNLLDLVVTDPPYNVDYQGGDRTEMKARHRRTDGLKIRNDKMTDDDFHKFLYDFYTATGMYTKDGGIWYVWHADMETVNFRTAMIEAGLTPKQCLIWNKGVMVMGRQDYHWKHEPCLYGWKEGAAHGWYSDRKQTTVLDFERPTKSKEHPTMKPVALIAYQISNSSKSGDIVGDSFLGSGTTMVAAHQLNRKCYGMELDPKYCQVIIDRMLKLDPNLTIIKNGVPLVNGKSQPEKGASDPVQKGSVRKSERKAQSTT